MNPFSKHIQGSAISRRQCLGAAAVALPVLGLWPDVNLLAQQAQDFISGAPVPDIAPQRVSERVWMIYAPDGFPTPENRGMMSNVCFVVTAAGVVILDSGSSLQIGQMALRVIRRVTPLPVVAVFNSHFHGDHWLGNHAFALAHGPDLPIYALPQTIEAIRGVEGNAWRALMERWTNQSTAGTQIVPPNRSVTPGQVIAIGGMHFKMHHHGPAHTAADLSVQVVEEGVTAVGDVVMGNRIANMDDGTYLGSFAYCKALAQQAGDQLWLPGHGQPGRDLLARYTRFLAGIWEPCLQAVKDGQNEAQARARVLADPRVAERAASMQGFANNIGKYISLAYLEAEKEAF